MNIHYNTIQQDYLCCDVHEMTFLYGSKMIDLYLTLMWQTLRYLYQFQSPEHLQFPWLNLQAKKIMNKKYIRITIANNGEFIERERERERKGVHKQNSLWGLSNIYQDMRNPFCQCLPGEHHPQSVHCTLLKSQASCHPQHHLSGFQTYQTPCLAYQLKKSNL